MGKRILVLNGSPTKGGNTETLSKALIKGAEEAGHTAILLTISDMQIAPFRGMAQEKDDMSDVLDEIVRADVVVWASPLYWMQFTGQLKVVMDRMSFQQEDNFAGKETALLACAASPEEVIRENLYRYYQLCFIESMKWIDKGAVLAGGVFAPGQVADTEYIKQSYELGKSL